MTNLISRIFKKKIQEPLLVDVQPSGEQFSVQPNQTLLQGALSTGIPFPHDCRVGTCGKCKCRLVAGNIKPITDFSYTLSREEIEQGYILTCQSFVKSNLTVQADLPIKSPNHKIKSIDGIIVDSTTLTHDILKITIELEEDITFEAGQYADISVPGITEPRSYSFANASSSLGSSEISFFIRHVPNGEMSGWFHEKSRIGEKVQITGPYGSFYLRDSTDPIICMAGGSGLAPIKAILEQESRLGGNTPVLFLFGARMKKDLYCLDEIHEFITSWNAPFHFIPVLSEEPLESDWDGDRGLVTEYIKDYPGIRLSSCKAYLCGPPGMIDAAIDRLHDYGINTDQIFFDKFLERSHLSRK
jgi:NAD(P)H-flavin reductase/ferredoxin